MDEYVEEAL